MPYPAWQWATDEKFYSLTHLKRIVPILDVPEVDWLDRTEACALASEATALYEFPSLNPRRGVKYREAPPIERALERPDEPRRYPQRFSLKREDVFWQLEQLTNAVKV